MNSKNFKFSIKHVTFSKEEIKHLLRAWIVLSLAFTILSLGGWGVFDIISSNPVGALIILSVSLFVTAFAFVFHELGHKITAQRYHLFAEFRAFDEMLLLAVVMSFFGFIFAAPGAVFIHGDIDRKKNGKISAAGPIVNIAIALIILPMLFILPDNFFKLLLAQTFTINAWIGLFNMIPFGNFDGRKILDWNKWVYGVMAGAALVLMLVANI